MKNLLRTPIPFAITTAISIAALLSIATSAAAAQACVQVEAHNVRPDQGPLMVAAFGDAAQYGKTPIAALQMPATADKLSFSVCGLTGPAVALRMFQDLNGNSKLDTNMLGMPSEPWGASGKPPAMSAPTWDTTQVPTNGGTIVVKLSQ
jgi:uncharacterized protein (DUF2141 family)